MLEIRLRGLQRYLETKLPTWGPDLSGLDLENLTYYIDPNISEKDSWAELPKEITETFDKLGIPKAEQEYLGGVGAQYDSGIVYHRLKKSLQEQGVIFENMDVAVQKYPELVEKYFMTSCVPVEDHKFTMLHAAVWSGGTFIYVPPGVHVKMPLQAYFRMNTPSSGQFEHTLIIADVGSSVEYIEGCSAPKYTSSSLHAGCVELHVLKDAKIKYSSIENWSKNTYNLNTKKALVYERGRIEWLNGNMGSRVTMLYPTSLLLGEYAHADSFGVTFAGANQIQDTGSKVIHLAPNTTSVIRAKSISKEGGVSIYRGFVQISPRATHATSSVNCDGLLLDSVSVSHTYPTIQSTQETATIAHEASVGKVSNTELFYLKCRGYNEEDATRMLVGGFVDPLLKALPLEYAIELNRLIDLEMEPSI